MVRTLLPRVVVVTRPDEYEQLLARHGTYGQTRFFLESRGAGMGKVESRHHGFDASRTLVAGAIPMDWRRTWVDRLDLDRFLFDAGDIVVVLGQDGLVANVAKYLRGQPVIGINPEPGRNMGVLVRHEAPALAGLLADVDANRSEIEELTMVKAELEGGGKLLALNEIFIGQRTHQSARYRLQVAGQEESQSSSGLIISSGTGSTGWASSIYGERKLPFELPHGTSDRLAWFVREAWKSPTTSATLTAGLLNPGESLRLVSAMEDGVLFGDGIEADHLALPWGQPVTITRAKRALKLVV